MEKAGYNAKASEASNDDDAMADKEKADQVYYQKLMREMTVALLLGVPLMIYGVMYVVAQTFIALERKVVVQREVEGIFKHRRVMQKIAKDVATPR